MRPLKLPDTRRLLELCDGADHGTFAAELLGYVLGRDVFFGRVEACHVEGSLVRPYFTRFFIPEGVHVDLIGPTSTRHDLWGSAYIYADTIEKLARDLRETRFVPCEKGDFGGLHAAWAPPEPAPEWTLDRAREVAPHFFDSFARVEIVHKLGAVGLSCSAPKFPMIACEDSKYRALPWSKEVSDQAGGDFAVVEESVEAFAERARRISFEVIRPDIRTKFGSGPLREALERLGPPSKPRLRPPKPSAAHGLPGWEGTCDPDCSACRDERIQRFARHGRRDSYEVESAIDQHAVSEIVDNERVPAFRHPRTKPEVSIIVDDMSGDDVGGDV